MDETEKLADAPHTRMLPRVFPDGDIWCALYGDDPQSGVAGFGRTPHEACLDFDRRWMTQLATDDAGAPANLPTLRLVPPYE